MGRAGNHDTNGSRTRQCMENAQAPLLRAIAGLYGDDVNTGRV